MLTKEAVISFHRSQMEDIIKCMCQVIRKKQSARHYRGWTDQKVHYTLWSEEQPILRMSHGLILH